MEKYEILSLQDGSNEWSKLLSCRDSSNDGSQHMVLMKRKLINYPHYPIESGAMSDLSPSDSFNELHSITIC